MTNKRKKPTIEELEKILDNGCSHIELMPDGSIRADDHREKIECLEKEVERWRARATLAETVMVAARKDNEDHAAPNAGHCESGGMPGTDDALETYDKARPHKDLGWANNWKENPQEFTDCRAAGHDTSDNDVGPPNRGIEHVVRCELCRIVHRYDSSD